jgi:hypothetical protein
MQSQLLLFCSLLLACGFVQAQSDSQKPPAPSSQPAQPTSPSAPPAAQPAQAAPPQAPQQEKKDKLTWGGDYRIRFVTADNHVDADSSLDDNWKFSRWRGRVWASVPIVDKKLKFNIRMTNEWRKWWDPDSTPALREKYKTRVNEFVFDNAYLDVNASKRVNLKIGRQDMFVGEGFVMMDGSPLDGSRTFYFNAARAIIRVGKGTVEGFGISNTTDDRYLPIINESNKAIYRQAILERDEQGAGVYVTQQLSKSLKGEFYDIFKREEPSSKGPLSRLNTTGVRFSGTVNDWFQHTGEFAYQRGDYGAFTRKGFGGYLDVRKPLKSVPKLALQFNYTYLSGDDPNTPDMEGWNPIFSRWPKWSELYLYTLAQEGVGPGYWTNLNMVSSGFAYKFSDKLTADFTYRLMRSAEPRLIAGKLSGQGRGQLTITRFLYKVNKHWTGHFWGEVMRTGDFYKSGSSTAYFIRTEFMFVF